jgi:hypothetical protein
VEPRSRAHSRRAPASLVVLFDFTRARDAGQGDVGVRLVCWQAVPDTVSVYSAEYTPVAACAAINVTASLVLRSCAEDGAALAGRAPQVQIVGNAVTAPGAPVSLQMLGSSTGDVGVAWFEPNVMPEHEIVVSAQISATAPRGAFCGAVAVVFANADTWSATMVVVELAPTSDGWTSVVVYADSGLPRGPGVPGVVLHADLFDGTSHSVVMRILVRALFA